MFLIGLDLDAKTPHDHFDRVEDSRPVYVIWGIHGSGLYDAVQKSSAASKPQDILYVPSGARASKCDGNRFYIWASH